MMPGKNNYTEKCSLLYFSYIIKENLVRLIAKLSLPLMKFS